MRQLLLLFTLAGALLCCSSPPDEVSIRGNCGGSASCPEGMDCTPAGWCAVTEGSQPQLILETEGKDSPALIYQWDVTGEKTWTANLAAPLALDGIIKEEGNPLVPSIPAELFLERSSLVPGRVLSQSVKAAEGVDENFKAFTLFGLSSVAYSLYVYPEDKERPAQTFPVLFEDDDVSLLLPLPALEGDKGYPLVVGTLYDQEVFETSGENIPLTDVSVFAMNSDRTLQSTLSNPDSKLGSFSLRLPPAAGDYSIFARGQVGEDTTTPIVPLTQLGVIQIEGQLGEIVQAGEYYRERQARYPLLVRVEEETSKAPLNQIQIALQPTEDTGMASMWYGKTGETNPGTWLGHVPAGEYKLVLSPPPSSLSSQWVQIVEVGPNTPELTVSLKPKATLEGVVRGWGGAPLPFASLECTLEESPSAAVHRATTNENGEFTLRLSPGVYRVTILPGDDTPMPRWSERDIVVEDSEKELVWSAPRPHYFEGQVIDSEGQSVPETDVRLLSGSQTDGGGTRTITLCETRTDEAGQFHCLYALEPLEAEEP